MLTTSLLTLPKFQTFLRPCVLSRTCQGPPKSGQFSNLEKQVEPRRNCYAQNVKSVLFIQIFQEQQKNLNRNQREKNTIYIVTRRHGLFSILFLFIFYLFWIVYSSIFF